MTIHYPPIFESNQVRMLTIGISASWHGISFDSTGDYITAVVNGGYIYTTSCQTVSSVTSYPSIKPTPNPTQESCTVWNTWAQSNVLALNYYGLASDATG